MIKTYEYNGEKWIDIDQGTPEELHRIIEDYGIHPFVGKELTSATPKPRVEFHGQYIYCIMHFPTWKHTHGQDRNQEIDFIIGNNILITARYDMIDALHKFGKDLEVDQILKRHPHEENSQGSFVFTNMLRYLYESVFEELEYIEDVTEGITGKIFKGEEKEMVVKISEVTRTLLDFKKVTDAHHEILESLSRHGEGIFGKSWKEEIESITTDYKKINTTIKSNMETLHQLLETNNSLLTSKQNETVKNFTIIGSVLALLFIIITIILAKA